MSDLFTTREIAIIIWGLIIFFCFVLNKDTRKHIINIVKILVGKQLRNLILMVLLYNTIMTFFIQMYTPFFKLYYLKDIVLWVITSGIVIAFNACDKNADEKYISKVIEDNIGVAIVFTFIVNTFTFNLIIEVILIPIVFFITAINILTESKKEYKQVNVFSKFLLVLIYILVFAGTVVVGIEEYQDLNTVDTLSSLFIPIVYLILDIPLFYLIQIIAIYQIIFIRMSFKDIQDDRIMRRHRLQVINICGISVKKLRQFKSDYLPQMYQLMKEETFETIIKDFKDKT